MPRMHEIELTPARSARHPRSATALHPRRAAGRDKPGAPQARHPPLAHSTLTRLHPALTLDLALASLSIWRRFQNGVALRGGPEKQQPGRSASECMCDDSALPE